MLAVTDAAMLQLHNTLQSATKEDNDSRCFRIVPKDNTHLTLSLAEPAASDTTFEHEGDTVLAVPRELKEFCESKSLVLNDDGKLELA